MWVLDRTSDEDEQGDLNQMLGAGHLPRAILAPSNPAEGYRATITAFDLAERSADPRARQEHGGLPALGQVERSDGGAVRFRRVRGSEDGPRKLPLARAEHLVQVALFGLRLEVR